MDRGWPEWSAKWSVCRVFGKRFQFHPAVGLADEVFFELLQGCGHGGIGAASRLTQPARGERSCSLDPLVDENAQDVVERRAAPGPVSTFNRPLFPRHLLTDDALHLGIGLFWHSLDGVRLIPENVESPLDLRAEDLCGTSPFFAQSRHRDRRIHQHQESANPRLLAEQIRQVHGGTDQGPS
jgi:hypothetical protein